MNGVIHVIEEESEERYKINSNSQSRNKSSRFGQISNDLVPEPEMSVIIMPEPASADDSYRSRIML